MLVGAARSFPPPRRSLRCTVTLMGLVHRTCTHDPQVALTPSALYGAAPERRPLGPPHSMRGGPGRGPSGPLHSRACGISLVGLPSTAFLYPFAMQGVPGTLA